MRSRIMGPGLFGTKGVHNYCALTMNQPLLLEREPANPVDTNAIIVRDLMGAPCGYLERAAAARVAPQMDSGIMFMAKIVGLRSPSNRTKNIALVWRNGDVDSDENIVKRRLNLNCRCVVGKIREPS